MSTSNGGHQTRDRNRMYPLMVTAIVNECLFDFSAFAYMYVSCQTFSFPLKKIDWLIS